MQGGPPNSSTPVTSVIRDNGISVDYLGQVETRHTHRMNLDGRAGGGHTDQFIHDRGREGIAASLQEEAVYALGVQVKGRHDLRAVLQNGPDYLIGAIIVWRKLLRVHR